MLENNQKICTKCNKILPITNFYKYKDKLRNQCKPCFNSYDTVPKEIKNTNRKIKRAKKREEVFSSIPILEGEIFKPILGYENAYKVSNYGRIVSLSKQINCYQEKLKSFELCKGYPRVSLWNNGKGKHFFIHRLVAEAFIPNPDNKPHINHINGIKTDYSINNLEWCTPKENIEHSIRTGLAGTTLHKKTKLNKSGYIGVSYCKLTKKWLSRITINKKRISLGYFIDVIEAAKAYDKALDKYLDNTYQRNFPI